MRMDRSLRSPRAWRWPVVVAAIAAMLSPAQAHASAGTGLPVSNYSGLQQLHYPVWGMSPASTADDNGGYGSFGVEGLAFPYYGTGADAGHPNEGLSQCHGCATEDVVTPHASFLALDVARSRPIPTSRPCARSTLASTAATVSSTPSTR
jgi:hypothetical protein